MIGAMRKREAEKISLREASFWIEFCEWSIINIFVGSV